jgi:hypothetical protein
MGSFLTKDGTPKAGQNGESSVVDQEDVNPMAEDESENIETV